ncbi:unnamed protein product [Rotaria sordida]|uniref:Uncharacterized protein n=1 Tax=Rotaria sordida TaxID=392033 RepID=A0A819RHI5_9BILA|nr:unnamed protein product [Rotaria sordida]CAF4040806.1 unnamed protein product [Rotaria sordida]
MKNSFRKSFSYRLRKKTHSDDHVYPRIDTNNCSNSKLNLVKPIKSKSFLQLRRRRRSSSSSLPPPPPPSSSSSDQIKSTVFEPRYDIHDDPISSSINSHSHPFDRLTYQIRKSFRNTLRRQRSRLGSINSNKQLILNKNDENPLIYPIISTGLTSPLTIKIDDNNNNKKQRKAPLAPTHMNQSISLPIEMNVEKQQQQSGSISSNDQQLDDNNNKQNLKKTNFNRFFRINFSFLPKTQQQQQDENHNEKLTLRQRFDSLRRSFHILSNKHNGHLLSNE